MKYNEIDKMLFYHGFTEGIRNVRKKYNKYCTLIASFKDEDNIDKLFIGLRIKNCYETIYSCSIKLEYYEQAEKALEEVLRTLETEVTKFIDSLNDKLDKLKSTVIIEWS